ncbi:MAG: hypothetical protein GTN76_14680 [Candidatus Aenigmarchaeota archaeon]|nr:hypothetical protein [Candidatus Aenigmarchaeota archaeon]
MKSISKLIGLLGILHNLGPGEVKGTLRVGVKTNRCSLANINRYIPVILGGPPVAKALD